MAAMLVSNINYIHPTVSNFFYYSHSSFTPKGERESLRKIHWSLVDWLQELVAPDETNLALS